MESPIPHPLLAAAADEARILGHGYLGAEHLLIAASRRVSPTRARVLARHGVTPDALRDAVSSVVGAPGSTPDAVRPLQPTMRARRALERAAEHEVDPAAGAATDGRDGPATADALLAGLLAPDVAPGAVVGAALAWCGVDLPALRRDVLDPPAGAPG